ncbi:hypothetical protein J0H58_05510 [bacterium]|nr:hypothetical protein [bacterium]
MDGQPADFAVKGVVLHGKVVLDAPVPLPDGTLVTIRLYDPGELPGEGDVPESLKDWVHRLSTLVDIQGVKLKGLERAVKGLGGQEAA